MKPAKRPARVTLLAIGVLIIAGVYLVRFWQAVVQWDFLTSILPFSPLYLALSGAFWGLVALPVFWGLWRGKSWARWTSFLFALAFLTYFWLDRLILANSPSARTNWPFLAGLSIIVLLFLTWTIFFSKARAFFDR